MNPPFVDQLNQAITDTIAANTQLQRDYFSTYGKYKQMPITDITPVGVEGILTGRTDQYQSEDDDKQGVAAIFQYTDKDGNKWNRGINFVVDSIAENWRTFDWTPVTNIEE